MISGFARDLNVLSVNKFVWTVDPVPDLGHFEISIVKLSDNVEVSMWYGFEAGVALHIGFRCIDKLGIILLYKSLLVRRGFGLRKWSAINSLIKSEFISALHYTLSNWFIIDWNNLFSSDMLLWRNKVSTWLLNDRFIASLTYIIRII